MHSVTLGGKDITDRVFDLQADATSLVVTYTDRPSKVSGIVTDERGAPSQTAVVVAFPVDPQLWSGYGGSPRTLNERADERSGVYTINHLPRRRLLRVAIDDADIDGWRDSEHARGARAAGHEADRRRWRCAEDARSAREGDSMIGRSHVVLVLAIVCGAAAAAQPASARQRTVALAPASISGQGALSPASRNSRRGACA